MDLPDWNNLYVYLLVPTSFWEVLLMYGFYVFLNVSKECAIPGLFFFTFVFSMQLRVNKCAI